MIRPITVNGHEFTVEESTMIVNEIGNHLKGKGFIKDRVEVEHVEIYLRNHKVIERTGIHNQREYLIKSPIKDDINIVIKSFSLEE